MKLKTLFKTIAGTLMLLAVALAVFSSLAHGIDRLSVLLYISFGLILGLSAACLVAGELFGKTEELENRISALEEALKNKK